MAISSQLNGISRVMAALAGAGAAIQPVAVAYIFFEPGHTSWLMWNVDLSNELTAPVPLTYRLIALACAMVPVAFDVWALLSLSRLFGLYAKGEVFTRAALRLLNHVALALFGGVVASFFAHGAETAALTWPLGEGHRFMSLNFGSGDIAALFWAGVVLVIARVMAEGSLLADENAKFV